MDIGTTVVSGLFNDYMDARKSKRELEMDLQRQRTQRDNTLLTTAAELSVSMVKVGVEAFINSRKAKHKVI